MMSRVWHSASQGGSLRKDLCNSMPTDHGLTTPDQIHKRGTIGMQICEYAKVQYHLLTKDELTITLIIRITS